MKSKITKLIKQLDDKYVKCFICGKLVLKENAMLVSFVKKNFKEHLKDYECDKCNPGMKILNKMMYKESHKSNLNFITNVTKKYLVKTIKKEVMEL